MSTLAGCAVAPGNASSTGHEGGDGGAGAGASALASLAVSPLPLVPSFSPAVHDYYVRCGAGDNVLSVTIAAPPGGAAAVLAPVMSDSLESQTVTVTVHEDDAIVVKRVEGGSAYWVRCLPHDFPSVAFTLHPEHGATTPGYYLLGNAIVAAGQAGFAMILDRRGTPVWYQRVAPSVVNVDWQPDGRISFIKGSGSFGNDPTAQYQLLRLEPWSLTTVQAVGAATDFHDLRTLPNGNHYVLSYPLVQNVDLTGLGTLGAGQTIPDCAIQEIDTAGKVVWQWQGSQHIDPVKESADPVATSDQGANVVDVFHCNSVEPYDDGHVLMSARNLDAVWLVDKGSGKIVWKLGGKPFSKDGAQLIAVVGDPETRFYHQHDARRQPNGHITLFDDHTGQPGMARGVEYALDLGASTARMVWQYSGPRSSLAMGSFRHYADGSSLIAWGFSGTVVATEVDDAGRDLLDISFGDGNSSYRAVKVPQGAFDIGLLRAAVGRE